MTESYRHLERVEKHRDPPASAKDSWQVCTSRQNAFTKELCNALKSPLSSHRRKYPVRIFESNSVQKFFVRMDGTDYSSPINAQKDICGHMLSGNN